MIPKHKIQYVDIGCSGGPHPGVHLDAISSYVGVDPLKHEIEKLRKDYPKFEFITGYVGKIAHEKNTSSQNNIVSRYHIENLTPFYAATSFLRPHNSWIKNLEIARGTRMKSPGFVFGTDFYKYWQKCFSEDPVRQEKEVTFDTIYKHLDFDKPDAFVLKVDTDGSEINVLDSWVSSSADYQKFKGVEIEAQLHGITTENNSCFSNIDRFLGNLGFVLVDMDLVKYSNSASPYPFAYPDCPADSVYGTPQWVNCKYLKLDDVLNDAANESELLHLLAICRFWKQVHWEADILYRLSKLNSEAIGGLDALSRRIFGCNWKKLQEDFTKNPKNSRIHKKFRIKEILRNIKRNCFDLALEIKNYKL